MPAGASVLIPLIAARWSRTGKPHAQGRGRDEDGMKTLLATIIGLAIVAVANPASPYVVAITTSIPAKSVEDRIYILLLIGDSEGEEMMKKLLVEGTTDIKLPNHEEAISPVTILDGQGRVVRVVSAQEFRQRAVTAGLSPARAKKYDRPARTVASVAAL